MVFSLRVCERERGERERREQRERESRERWCGGLWGEPHMIGLGLVVAL